MTGAEQPRSENAIQPVSPSEKDQASKIGQAGDVEFERLKKSDLKSVPVLVQALDNQWLPRTMLEQVQKRDK